MKYWLVKSDPDTYSWSDFEKKTSEVWDGIRNYQARNYLKEMKKNDKVLFYHSGGDKAVIGLARVGKEHYPDPGDKEWEAVELIPDKKLTTPVSLAAIKSEPLLKSILLVRNSRLSVIKLTTAEYEKILSMAGA